MSELLHRFQRSSRAHDLFKPGQRILVAVSGGLDSMVLLHLLHDVGVAFFPYLSKGVTGELRITWTAKVPAGQRFHWQSSFRRNTK